jgi:hypothetical protein
VADDADRGHVRDLADDDVAGDEEHYSYSADGDSSAAFTAAHGLLPKTQQKPGESLEEW